jgi:hypothetical protein
MKAIIKTETGGNIKLELSNVQETQRNRIWNQIHFLGKSMNVYPFLHGDLPGMVIEFWVSNLTPEKNILAIKVICQEIGATIN